MKIKAKLLNVIIILLSSLSVVLFSAAPSLAIAQCRGNDSYICENSVGRLTSGVLKNVINVLLYIAGTVAVIVIIVGGIRYITSDGDPTKATQAKNTIIYALVGVVVAVMSYSFVNFVIGRL